MSTGSACYLVWLYSSKSWQKKHIKSSQQQKIRLIDKNVNITISFAIFPNTMPSWAKPCHSISAFLSASCQWATFTKQIQMPMYLELAISYGVLVVLRFARCWVQTMLRAVCTFVISMLPAIRRVSIALCKVLLNAVCYTYSVCCMLYTCA